MVRFLKPSVSVISIITLIMTTLVAPAISQSGRGRPKVPQPSSTTTPPPEPINIPASAAVVKQEQAGVNSRFVLGNGITVVISEHHATPIAAAVAYFKASALDEPWSLSGAARLAERMILKGTVLRPADRAVSDLRAIGASVESATSYDGAAYSVVSPSNRIKEALAIQADMLQNPSIDTETVRREIPLLVEEEKSAGVQPGVQVGYGAALRSRGFTNRSFNAVAGNQALSRMGGFDDPSAFSMARLFNIAFTDSASASLDALRSITREQIVEFYRTHYRPENLIVAVAGDVSTFNTLVEIQQLYGNFGKEPAKAADQNIGADGIKSKPSSARGTKSNSENQSKPANPATSSSETPSIVKTSHLTEQTRLRYGASRGDISQSIISMGFHVPGAESKDSPAIEMLMAVAGRGRASRLSRSLVDGQMVANRIEADYLSFAGAGFLAIQAWPATVLREGSSIDKTGSALFKEVDRLRRELPTDGEMARARTLLEKKFVDENAIYVSRANALARAEAAGVGFRAVLDYKARIRAVSAQDVQRVAARYLTLANVSFYEYEPFTAAERTFDPDTFSKTVTAWAPGFTQPIEAAVLASDANSSLAVVPQGSERSPDRQATMESVQPEPVKDFSTLNGPRAFVREDHSQQAVTVAILFQGGRIVEEATTSGMTELMLRSILYGTPRRSFTQVTQELEQLGADVRIVVEPDFFGFTLSVLSRNAERALKLLREEIEEPAFKVDDISRARLGQLAAIRDARDSSFTRSRELLLQALFPGHSYSLPPHGREEIVSALTAEKLAEWHGRSIKRQVPVAIIVGDTDGSALVSSQIAEGFKRRDVDTAIQVRTPQRASGGEKIEQRRREQTFMAVGQGGPRAESADLTAIELIETAMNGEGGRILRELRDKQNLISGGYIEDDPMFVAGIIGAYITTQIENEQKARVALLAEFERLAREGLTADELAAARSLATTSRVILQQSQSQHAIEYARSIFYRRQASDVDSFSEQASKVTADDIKRIAAAYLKSSAACTAVIRGTTQQPSASPPPKQD